MALAKRQAKLDGLNPAGITDLAIAVLIAAIVGSKLLMILVDLFTPAGQEGAMALRDVFTLAHPAGRRRHPRRHHRRHGGVLLEAPQGPGPAPAPHG